MTAPSRYPGQPVSEGIGLGEIYHGDPHEPKNGHRRPATEDEVRAAFAAVARDRATLAGQLRARGQDQQAEIGRTPLRRIAEAVDQAKVICFLASSDADFVTGLTIDVTGGN